MTEESRKSSLADLSEDDRREYWSCLALRACRGLGQRRITALVTRFGSAYGAVCAVENWAEAGIPSSCVKAFAGDGWRQKARSEWDAARVADCGILLWTDPAYPRWLRSIPDAPCFLYFYGDLTLFRSPAVAVVGTRACSEDGLRAAVSISRGLSAAGVTIVSGMARGIDRAAHVAGLEGPGRSIGVLGAGIDVEYPPSNRDLYALMRRHGLLVSELPPGFAVDGRWFPVRNRIISGLSLAVVVIEAAMRSGSLNTANHALDQNRELMSYPGSSGTESAQGCQELVRKGAKPVFNADDVLREIVPHLEVHVREGFLERDAERFRPRRDDAPPAVAEPLAAGLLPWRGAQAKEGPPVPSVLGSNSRAGTVRAKEGPFVPPVTGSGSRGRALQTPDGGPANGPEPEARGAGPAETHGNAAESERPLKGAARFPAEAGQGHSVEHDPSAELEGLELAVYRAAASGPIHIDDICRALGQDIAKISSAATMLEVRGFLLRLPGMVYEVRGQFRPARGE